MRIVLAGVVLFLSGCGTVTAPQYRAWSAEATGCPPKEITIRDAKSVIWAGQGINWVAQCQGHSYVCSNAGSTACTESPEYTTTAAAPTQPGSTTPPAP